MLRVSHSRLVWSFILLCISVACSQTTAEISEKEVASVGVEYSRPAADAPKLAYWGEYEVGVRTIFFTDTDRLQFLDIDPNTGFPKRADRRFNTIVWYPADIPDSKGKRALYTHQFIQNPKWPMPDLPITWTVSGHAFAEAPVAAGNKYPLVVLAHGWAGNHAALAYLGENIASKGYVVIAPDLQDVLPGDPQVFEMLFPRAMINRAVDINFILEAGVNAKTHGHDWLADIIDVDRTALVGNSLGGMGALRVAGAAYDADSPGATWIPGGLFVDQTTAAEVPKDVHYEDLDALVLIAPWGAQEDVALFSAESLSEMQTPLLIMSGDLDAIAGYETGPRRIFEHAGSTVRYFLTFESAGHGIIPGPVPAAADKYPYGAIGSRDAVWRAEALAAIQQHFVTAFLDATLKGDAEASAYLAPKTKRASDGVWPPVSNEPPDTFAPLDADGVTYWPGFRRHRARGLALETGAAPISGEGTQG